MIHKETVVTPAVDRDSWQEECFLEQYKLYVQTAETVSQRRADLGKVYTTILSTLIGIGAALGTWGTMGSRISTVVSIVGLILCIVWALTLRSLKQLNSAKFNVIGEMEKTLPFPCFTREWEILSYKRGREKYFTFSKIEVWMPIACGFAFLVMLAWSLRHT